MSDSERFFSRLNRISGSQISVVLNLDSYSSCLYFI